jgi:UDP:flavonoid glycosyltransferase YjiC (YdhE family)
LGSAINALLADRAMHERLRANARHMTEAAGSDRAADAILGIL